MPFLLQVRLAATLSVHRCNIMQSCLILSVLQGIGRLTLVLQQFALAAAAVGTLTLLEAANTFPSIVKVAAVLCLGFTGALVGCRACGCCSHAFLGRIVRRQMLRCRPHRPPMQWTLTA